MSDGQAVYNFVNQHKAWSNINNPNFKKLGDFIRTNDNRGMIQQSYLRRFGNNTPKPKLPVE
ncbi:hypothetical protein PV783_21305 [Chitinophaga sp. CC14]|uniref:hypothetical protein n=1 Tax=Chitinophaga sp. CC14 TaxID=3029199 RepID=UPI003B7EFCF5